MTTQPEANQVPLVELLASVPADIRIGVDDGNDWKAGTTWHPVGQLCHEAAAELRRLHQSEREGWRYAKEWEARAIRLAKALGQAMEALEQIAAYRPLTFAECSDAEAVMGIAEKAIGK